MSEVLDFHFHHSLDWTLYLHLAYSSQVLNANSMDVPSSDQYRDGLRRKLDTICKLSFNGDLAVLQAQWEATFQCPLFPSPKNLPFALKALLWMKQARESCSQSLLCGLQSILVEAFSNAAADPLKAQFLPALSKGHAKITIAVAEASCGEQLAQIASYGKKMPDGSWRLYGEKTSVFAADADCCFVLAKNEQNGRGINALSLFFCPRQFEENSNYTLISNPNTLAIDHVACCNLKFDHTRAWLIGAEGEGFDLIAPLLDEMRLVVALNAIALLEQAARIQPTVHIEDLELNLGALQSLAFRLIDDLTIAKLCAERISQEPSFEEKADLRKMMNTHFKRFSRKIPALKFAATSLLIKHGSHILQTFTPDQASQAMELASVMRCALSLTNLVGSNQELAKSEVHRHLKKILAEPQKFFATHLSEKVRSSALHDPLRRKWYQLRDVRRSSYLWLILASMAKGSNSPEWSNVSDATHHPARINQWLQALRSYVGRPKALLASKALSMNASILCELHCLSLMSDALIKDSLFNRNRFEMTRLFLRHALARAQYIYQKVSLHQEGEHLLIEHRQVDKRHEWQLR